MMKRCIHALALGLILLVTTAGQAGPLTGEILFNTGVFPCDGVFRYLTWVPPDGNTVYLKSLNFEMGMDFNGLADYFVGVVRQPDSTWVARQGWDHYANPTGPFVMHWIFSPDYYTIHPTSILQIHYICVGFSTPPPTAEIVIMGGYTVGSP